MDVRIDIVPSVPGSNQLQLKETRVLARQSSEFPFTEVGVIPAPETSLLLQDVNPAPWEYQFIEVDTNDRIADEDDWLVIGLDLSTLDAPSGTQSATATVV